MSLRLDTASWSGEGVFTQVLVESLSAIGQITAVKVEDAPSTRSEADYNFISNEIFVVFATAERVEPIRRLGVFPGSRRVAAKSLTLDGLRGLLEGLDEIGAPDYSDEGMLQYPRTERVIPPYQTRGYKIVELVRIYEAAGAGPDG